MYKFIRAYRLGFFEGIKAALKEKNKKFKQQDEMEVMSKLYDIAYIKGYNKCMKYLKNNL